MPVIVGVDPGSSATGFGVIRADGSRLQALLYDVIKPPRGQPFEQRLLHIYRQFIDLLRLYHPQVVALEDIFHALNVKSVFKLAQVRGVITLAAAEEGVPLHEYTPLEVKQALVGYGRAEKGQVQRMVQVILGLPEPPFPLDVSDALALAICHAHTSSTIARLETGGQPPRGSRRK